MPHPTELTIAARFRGPPDSGNGGYVCGAFAVAVGTELRVRLLSPPPLDTPLALAPDLQAGAWRLCDGERVVATGVAVDRLELETPNAPPYVQAVWASQH
jgi:hypothetical protein